MLSGRLIKSKEPLIILSELIWSSKDLLKQGNDLLCHQND